MAINNVCMTCWINFCVNCCTNESYKYDTDISACLVSVVPLFVETCKQINSRI